MRPTLSRLFTMANLHTTTISAEAAELLDEALTASGDSPMHAAGWLLARYPTDGLLLESLDRRLVVMLAIQVLFTFAPETGEALKAMEERQEGTTH